MTQGIDIKRRQWRVWLLLCGVILSYWGIGFWPYRWNTCRIRFDNAATWTALGHLAFGCSGLAVTKMPLAWVPSAVEYTDVDIELVVQPYEIWQENAYFFTAGVEDSPSNLSLGQHQNGLILLLRTADLERGYWRASYLPEVFRTTEPIRIVMHVRPEELSIEINGRPMLREALSHHVLSNWDMMARLALGNDFTLNHPWRGEMHRPVIRVRNQSFSYTTDQFAFPANRHGCWQQAELRPFSSGAPIRQRGRDWVINVLWFIPLGMLIVRTDPLGARLMSVFFWGLALSLSIELGQCFISVRYPSSTDIFLNTVGGVMGAWISNKGLSFYVWRS